MIGFRESQVENFSKTKKVKKKQKKKKKKKYQRRLELLEGMLISKIFGDQ